MGNDKKKSLVFVYNADSGLFNTLTDIAHKVFSPSTYECNLCAITHSHFSMRTAWSEFLETLQAELEFLHRDELYKQYNLQDIELPAIFLKQNEGKLDVAVTANEINACENMDDLQKIIKDVAK